MSEHQFMDGVAIRLVKPENGALVTSKGDSGGPYIDSAGCLVAVHHGAVSPGSLAMKLDSVAMYQDVEFTVGQSLSEIVQLIPGITIAR